MHISVKASSCYAVVFWVFESSGAVFIDISTGEILHTKQISSVCISKTFVVEAYS